MERCEAQAMDPSREGESAAWRGEAVSPVDLGEQSQTHDDSPADIIKGCLALWGLSFALDHYEYHLVPSRLPSRTEADDDAEVGVWLHNLSWAIGTTACLLQLRLNRLSRTFAGNYALVTYLNLVRQVCLALFFTPLVGIYEAREHFGFIHTVDFLVVAGWAWQAITYPRVEQAVEEDD